jgi:hypothetical protein
VDVARCNVPDTIQFASTLAPRARSILIRTEDVVALPMIVKFFATIRAPFLESLTIYRMPVSTMVGDPNTLDAPPHLFSSNAPSLRILRLSRFILPCMPVGIYDSLTMLILHDFVGPFALQGMDMIVMLNASPVLKNVSIRRVCCRWKNCEYAPHRISLPTVSEFDLCLGGDIGLLLLLSMMDMNLNHLHLVLESVDDLSSIATCVGLLSTVQRLSVHGRVDDAEVARVFLMNMLSLRTIDIAHADCSFFYGLFACSILSESFPLESLVVSNLSASELSTYIGGLRDAGRTLSSLTTFGLTPDEDKLGHQVLQEWIRLQVGSFQTSPLEALPTFDADWIGVDIGVE